MSKQLITQFNLHHLLFNNVLDGFSDSETNQRLNSHPKVNHIKYLAGHLLNSQYGLAGIAGLDVEVKWNDLFAVMGQSEAKDNISYPHIDEIKYEWNTMHEDIHSGLENLSLEALETTPPAPFDQVSDSIGDLWAFINHHQGYHIGQIGLLRRAFGKPAMKYD